MPQLTNPAAELHSLCKKLEALPGRQEAARDVLARCFGVSPDETNFYAIITALSSRFDALAELINIIPQYANPQKAVALNAVSHVRGFLRAHSLNNNWDSVKSAVFKPDFLVPIHMIDPLIQMIAPISLPTEEEKQRILASLDEAITELLSGNGIVATSLAISLKSTRKVLEKLEFFGVDELLERIINSDLHLRAAARAPEFREKSSMMSSLRKAALALSLVLNVLVVSDSGVTAIENDYRRGQALIEFINGEIEVAPLQLPAPKPDENHSEAVLPEDGERPEDG